MNELNELEFILKGHGERGLSTKQIKLKFNLSKRQIRHLVYTSHFIEDTNPYLHGSSKSRIDVYNYTPTEKKYLERRIKKYVKTPDLNFDEEKIV